MGRAGLSHTTRSTYLRAFLSPPLHSPFHPTMVASVFHHFQQALLQQLALMVASKYFHVSDASSRIRDRRCRTFRSCYRVILEDSRRRT
jgi:hypothetical protein